MRTVHLENFRYLWRYAALVLLGAGIWSAFFSLAAWGNKTKSEKRTMYGTGVETGFKFVRYHDNCIFLRVFFVSGDFFLGLKQVDTPTGKQIAKGKQIYHNFPDNIVVDVQADAIPCDISTQRLPPPDIASGLLSTLSFTAGWRINNADLQSSVVVPTKIEHLNNGIRWNYFLEIPAKDIPLTTELAIGVTARDRIRLATFTAHL
jgi:hypothetical protein